MTNPDTNTLNGALEQLGTTMANNLTTMGVTASPSDGLTTLAGKILLINPQTYNAVEVTSDKSILSHADSESCTLTAQLLQGQTPYEESGVTINFYKQIGTDTPVLLGTATTDNTGKATLNNGYTSAGVGDVKIYAETGSIISSEIYVEDCIIYDSNTYTSDTIKSWSNIPTNFKLSYIGKRTSNGVLWIEVGSDVNNNIFGGIISDRGYLGAYSRKNNSYEYSDYTSDALSVAEHEIIMIADSGSVTVNSESLTAQISGSTITARNWQKIHLTGSGGYIKDIKIKPL